MDNPVTIVLIGPVCAGKSTVGKVLAEQLGIPQVELDELRWDYYKEIGYDTVMAKEIADTEGMIALLRYWKPYEAYAVERVIATHSNCVIDFGAGHSVYEDDALFERVQAALAPNPYVVLIMPSPDLEASIAILNARFEQLLQHEVGTVSPELLSLNEHFVKHPSNHKLGKIVVYTQGKTPEETAREIIEKLG
ncbi:MAG: shikimate kinase [Anaerolineae bacterium]|nr:shikimate kinase [Anaerolineae bacterium]